MICLSIFIGQKKRVKANFKTYNLLRRADLRRTFLKGDTNNWLGKIYEITEIVNDLLPSYRIDNLPECYQEALLKKAKLTLKEIDGVMIKLNITQIKSKCPGPSMRMETNLYVNTKTYPFISLRKIHQP